MQQIKTLRAKFAQLQKARRSIETHEVGGKVIREWKTFLSYSNDEKAKRYSEWENYYVEVKKSLIYEMFMEQRRAFAEKNHARVRSLASEIKGVYESGEVVQQPAFTDPWELHNSGWVRAYMDVEKQIKNISDQMEIAETDISEIFTQ